jgi:hypothetical protein
MNNEYVAVRHLLTAPRIAVRASPFIGEESFDFDALAREAETMSGGEQLLVRIADELWSAERRAGLWEHCSPGYPMPSPLPSDSYSATG